MLVLYTVYLYHVFKSIYNLDLYFIFSQNKHFRIHMFIRSSVYLLLAHWYRCHKKNDSATANGKNNCKK